MPKNLTTIRDVCEQYGLSDKTVRRKIKTGELTAYRCGPRLLKLDADQVEATLMRPVGQPVRSGVEEHVSRVIAEWPRLTDEARGRIAALLTAGASPPGTNTPPAGPGGTTSPTNRKAAVQARIAELDGGAVS